MADISRRQVLALLAAGGGVAAAGKAGALDQIPAQAAGWAGEVIGGQPEAGAAVLVARAQDGLLFSLSLSNVEIRPGGIFTGPRLALIDETIDGYVVITLETQSVLEPAVFDEGLGFPTPVPPIPALASGPSRIVLKMAANSDPIDYDLDTLLDLDDFTLAVSDAAENGTGQDTPPEPGPNDTAIEAPHRLFLSPQANAAFTALTAPVVRNGRTELWHARAVIRDDQGVPVLDPAPVPVRAIWSPDLPGGTPIEGAPWAEDDKTVSLSKKDRADIVAATTGGPGSNAVAPANADLLLVSPMGASLDVKGSWEKAVDLTAWRHKMYLGRENYVKVERRGFLFPLRFPAVQVSITERVHTEGVAHLRKRMFIVVKVPLAPYPGAKQKDEGREWPFTAAETTTIVSPPIVHPDDADKLGKGYWVQVRDAQGQKKDLPYHVLLTGKGGEPVSAHIPLVFIPAADAFDPSGLGGTIGLYNGLPLQRRRFAFGGQRFSFVPPKAEDSSLPVFDLVLTAQPATANTAADLELAAFPAMGHANVHIEALATVGGAAASQTRIQIEPKYVAHKFDAPHNHGEVWAKIIAPEAGPLPKLTVPQQTGGGLAAPALNLAGLSLAHGPVADIDTIAAGTFDPTKYFPDLDITLLGGIPLRTVLKLVPEIPNPRTGDDAPKVITVRTPQYVETIVTWKPELQNTLDGLFEPATTEPDKRLDLKAVFHTDLGTGQTTTKVTGDLRNFKLNFVGKDLRFITQHVTRMHFESQNGAKPSIDLQLGKSEFVGDLGFLTDLQRFLPSLPGGVKIDASPSGVKAGLTIAVPAVGIGVLLVRNLSIGILLDLPFTGEQAVLTFSFATREHPFQVTVSALGGGGFFAVGLGTRGVQQIEGSIEFGAAVAIDLGVASGSVEIMAGIYFKYAQKQLPNGQPSGPAGKTLVITGYVRAVGKLSVLGLIHVSLEFYLGLSYVKQDGRSRVEGVATLSVRVEVLFFSTSVSVTMRKEFAAGEDPGFGQQITSGDWAKYCSAYAAA
ncbi:hypothetical protein [Catelliglobosispora koreensis]|uniref:hypothetical protein n=1 Tax=Catelliglobosispora koreensis TaxID=129052 RepID=UPI000363D997|nr:hypothetical protein [Catelliglobosispora koreensis]